MVIKETNITDSLLTHAQERPDATAFIILEDGEAIERKILYHDLESWVKSLASQLSDKQLYGQRVLLIYQNTVEFIIAFLACQYLGIIAVPVPYVKGHKQMARLRNIAVDAQVSAVLCAHFSVDYLKAVMAEWWEHSTITIISTDVSYSMIYVPIPQKAMNNSVSFIQYTSGSTGNPKGVIITADNLMHNQRLIHHTFGCNKDSVILSWLPFHHDMGLIGNILHTIYVGCTCVIMSPLHFIQSPVRWLRAISKYRVTHSGGPNFAYDLCCNKVPADELLKLDLSCWKVAYNGSEPVRYDTIQRFAACFKSAGFTQQTFYPCYGLAEATLLVSGQRQSGLPITIFISNEQEPDGRFVLVTDKDMHSKPVVSSGQIADGMEVQIFSRHHSEACKELEEGEICIAGDSVTSGYWNMHGTDVFHDRNGKKFLRTGDLGFLYQGELFVHGRLTEMLIVRGRNVYPTDIEELVSKSDTAIETNGVAAFCINDSGEQWVIAAEIKRTFIKSLDAASVIGAIDNAVTGSFGISPYDILLTTPLGIPRTTSGKLQRLKCKDDYWQGVFNVLAAKLQLQVKQPDMVLPALVIQDANYATIKRYLIGTIAARVGHLQPEQINDNIELTEIGVDSLRATELINSINKDLGINLNISKVLHDNSFSGLINMVEHMLWLKNGQTFGDQITI